MMRGKHIWLVPLLLAVLVGVVGWWAERELRRSVQQELRDDLQSTLDANVTALEIWMENQKRIAAALADEPGLKAGALKLLEQSASGFTNRPTPGELSRELFAGERVQERGRSLGYSKVQLVSTNMTVVSDVGRRRSRQGNKVLEELQPKYTELFTRGEPIIITPFNLRLPELPRRPGNRPGNQSRPPREFFGPPPTNSSPAAPPPRDFTRMQVAAPIKDNDGQTRGALALDIDPDAEFTRILSVASTGESGETLAFDGEGVLISKSRFDEELKRLKVLPDETNSVSALTLSLRDPGGDLTQGFLANTNITHPLIRMVELAVEGQAGVELSPFRDYRGVPVVGAWQWLPKYGFGVAPRLMRVKHTNHCVSCAACS